MSKKVTVSVGLRDVEVEVGDNDTGYEIKRAVYLSGKGFRDEILSWQLQGQNANGSNSIIGNNDRPWQTYFDLITIYDNA